MIEAYLALLGFIILMVSTPGPANMVAMLGGAQIGVRNCFRFILGLVCGKVFLNTFFGLGFGLFLVEQEAVTQTLKFVSAAYMIWLVCKSWNDRPSSMNGAHSFDFKHGLIVHPLNPKAWVMVILAWANFAPAIDGFTIQLFAVVASFAAVQLLFHTLWCFLGQVLGHAMRGNQALTRVLILVTVATVIWALLI